MLSNVMNLLYTDFGSIIISIVLGLGLASLFRKVCKHRNCMVFKAPSMKELNTNIYKYNDKCYTYKSEAIKCETYKTTIPFA